MEEERKQLFISISSMTDFISDRLEELELIDVFIQKLFIMQENILWRNYKGNTNYIWYYAENRIYLIKNVETNIISVVQSNNYKEALYKVVGLKIK